MVFIKYAYNKTHFFILAYDVNGLQFYDSHNRTNGMFRIFNKDSINTQDAYIRNGSKYYHFIRSGKQLIRKKWSKEEVTEESYNMVLNTWRDIIKEYYLNIDD